MISEFCAYGFGSQDPVFIEHFLTTLGICLYIYNIIRALTQENLSSVFMNNKGADQPAHQRRLISNFVIPLLESIILKLATSEISIFYLVFKAEQAGLSLALSETPRQVFSRRGPYDM